MLTFHDDHAHVRAGPHSIALDAPGTHAFVSHAHLDHYRSLRKAELVLSSSETMDLLSARGKTVPPKTVQHHQSEEEGATQVRLLNAGHVLGSRMLYAESAANGHAGQSVLYTGDFLSQDSLTQKAAQPKDCDVLLMECTYGLPQYEFVERAVMYDQIGKWASAELALGRIAVIGAYSLGKAQEVVAALNQAGIAPAVSPPIAALNEIYEKYGVTLDYTVNDAATLASGAFAAVVPMHQVKPAMAQGLKQAYGRKASLSVATGWALSGGYAGCDAAFALSDHNDFPGLIEFAQQCNPKKVYTTHGPADVFAHHLRKAGLDAQPLENLGQKQTTLA
ncbi:hypothetical protein HYV43_05505 [Candidatus Micrarchaeota archaeon]|nr:hypothetical protein [Candidatus Micrarchaeota archaeon]